MVKWKLKFFKLFSPLPPTKNWKVKNFLRFCIFKVQFFLSFLFFFPKKKFSPIEMSSSPQKKFFRSLGPKSSPPPPHLLQIGGGVKSQIWILTGFVLYWRVNKGKSLLNYDSIWTHTSHIRPPLPRFALHPPIWLTLNDYIHTHTNRDLLYISAPTNIARIVFTHYTPTNFP